MSGGERLPTMAFKGSWSCLTQRLYAGLGTVILSVMRVGEGHGFEPSM